MKRIMTIQDISCVGKCSLTVALPIISAAGVEAGVLPTAVLSTHTAFPKFTFCDLTDEIEKISNTLDELNIDFDAIYTGYLGSFRQIELVSDFVDRFNKEGRVLIVDPAMADNGKLYHGFTPEFSREMARLCAKADVIIPNLTEALLMLGEEYRQDYDEDFIRGVLKRLTDMGARCAALTGIRFSPDKIGVYAYDSERDEYFSYFNTRLPVSYHGTGDIYASATLGAYMRGMTLNDALALAVDFTLECMLFTERDEERRSYGVNFEEALPMYIKRIEENLKK